MRSTIPPLIGIVGAAGAGKDTVADYLVEEYGCQKYASGDPIKDVAMRHYGMSHEDCYTHRGKASTHAYLRTSDLSDDDRRKIPNGFTDRPVLNREVLELIGDKMNALDPLVLMRPMAVQAEKTGRPQVDPCTREKAQAQFIRDRGGVIIYVSCPQAETQVPEDAHHSAVFYKETRYDFVVDNDHATTDFETLRERIDSVVSLMRELAPSESPTL